MTQLKRAVATLRVRGDDLVPDEITALLGATPTHSKMKGDVLRGNWVERFGQWRLEATETAPGNVDAQVAELLGQLTTDLDVWRDLSSRYSIDVFCGFFMGRLNEGIDISPMTLKALGERGITLDLDIYAPGTGN